MVSRVAVIAAQCKARACLVAFARRGTVRAQAPLMRLARLRQIIIALIGLAILSVTLVPSAGSGMSDARLCLICGERGLANLIANLLLFLPLGLVLGLGTRPARLLLLIAALFSVGIEFTQQYVPGRNPNPTDVLFNTLGAAAGLALARSRERWLYPRPGAATGLAAAATALAVAIIVATGLLFGPAFTDARYFGQWTPGHQQLPDYPGRVVDARLGPIPITSGPLDTRQVRSLLEDGERFHVRAIMGPPLSRPWPFVRVVDRHSEEIASIGPHGADVVLRVRTRGAALRLDPPELRVAGALEGMTPGDTLAIRFWHEADGYCIDAPSGRACGLGFTSGRAWRFLHPAPRSPLPLDRAMDLILLATLSLVPGFWARTRRQWLVIAIVLQGTLLAVPFLTVLQPARIAELLASLAGVGIGRVLRQVLLRRRDRIPGPSPVTTTVRS
jgi:hypothetical protein